MGMVAAGGIGPVCYASLPFYVIASDPKMFYIQRKIKCPERIPFWCDPERALAGHNRTGTDPGKDRCDTAHAITSDTQDKQQDLHSLKLPGCQTKIKPIGSTTGKNGQRQVHLFYY